MPLNITTATCKIESLAPYTQSRYHEEPKLEGELSGDWDKRTWRKHHYVVNGTVHIPSTAIHQALVAAAKYSKRQIPGQGKATWTAKFMAGIALLDDIDLGLDPEKTDYIDIYCHTNGQRGSGSRVMRRFPTMPKWAATFDVQILDPIITKEVFEEMFEIAGMFVGVGQYAPRVGGTNGRFKLIELIWKDPQRLAA